MDVTTTDGLRLAVQQHGDPGNPTIVAVHGFPDDRTVWDGMVPLLADRFHVVTYDVRGAGASEAPETRQGYLIRQLVADLGAVIEATSSGPIHLLAHDWGSIQSWPAVMDPAFADRIASFTSISGPDLAMSGRWLGDLRSHPVATLRQYAASYYILGFHLPALPERVISAGLLNRLVRSSKRRGRLSADDGHAVDQRTATNGLELYRANFLERGAVPRPRSTDIPVQVLAPTDDPHVTSRLQLEAPVPYCTDLRTHEIPGNHWVISGDPGLVAGLVTRFVDRI